MILAILAFWWGYKKGRDSGRNGALWSVICGFTFIGIQLLVGLGAAVLLGVGIAMWGWDENALDKYWILVNLVALVPSVLVLWLIFRYLDRVPDEPVVGQPPPPPNFTGQ